MCAACEQHAGSLQRWWGVCGECVVCQLTDLQMHVVSTMLDARRAVWGVEALGVQG